MLIPAKDESLNNYLNERAYVDRETRIQLVHPHIFSRFDAFAYWVEIFRQDNPIYLVAGVIAGGGMLLHIIWKLLILLLHLFV